MITLVEGGSILEILSRNWRFAFRRCLPLSEEAYFRDQFLAQMESYLIHKPGLRLD